MVALEATFQRVMPGLGWVRIKVQPIYPDESREVVKVCGTVTTIAIDQSLLEEVDGVWWAWGELIEHRRSKGRYIGFHYFGQVCLDGHLLYIGAHYMAS